MSIAENLRLGWRGLSRANTLAYCEYSCMGHVKSFIRLRPGVLKINFSLASQIKCFFRSHFCDNAQPSFDSDKKIFCSQVFQHRQTIELF